MKYLPILPAAAAAAGIGSCDTGPERPTGTGTPPGAGTACRTGKMHLHR